MYTLSLCLHLSVHTHIHIYTYTCMCTPTRRPTFTGAYYRVQSAPTPFAAFSPFPLPLRPFHPFRPFYLSRPLRPGGHAADPASSDLRFSPGALGTLSFRRRVFAGNPHDRRGFPVPQAAPPKSIMSTVLPNTPFPKSKERMSGCWGGT